MAGPYILESFDNLATADLATLYDASGGGIVGAYGRGGTQGLRCTAGQAIAGLLPNVSDFVEGVACYIDADTLPSFQILSMNDTNANTCHLSLRINSDGSFSVYRGAAVGSSGPLTAYVLVPGTTSAVAKATLHTWMAIEWKGVIHASAGSVVVKVNGEEIINATGVNTHGSDAACLINKAYLGVSTGGSPPCQFDDWWVFDQTGGSDFLGDRVIESSVVATGNGTYTEWTPSTGSDHGAMVDDATSADGDTTYNATATLGRRDTYTFPALARVDTVDAVVLDLTLRKTASGTRAVAALTRSGGTDTLDGTNFYLTESYATYRVPITPLAGASVATVDAAELGAEVTT
jgi:hypothetical protein